MRVSTVRAFRFLNSGKLTFLAATAALTLAGVANSDAGTFHDEWPDAIMCKIVGKENAKMQVILYLHSFRENLNRPCAGASGTANSVEANYYSQLNYFYPGSSPESHDHNHYSIDFCSETTVPDAKPWIISDQFENCTLGMTIRDLKNNNQTRDFTP